MDDERYRRLVLLHNNDLHGDFLPEIEEGRSVGGVPRLSGYVQKVRSEEPSTIYCIAGDMLQGSLIDTEYQGLSTIELMNMLGPDVATLGNHEMDYGLAHLLFLERCARFPIISANMYITQPVTRLFKAHTFLRRNGMRIMFIGLITSEALSPLKSDPIISTMIDIYEAAREVGHICNAYRQTDVDLTVLLTHIGYEEDKKLAAMLDPDWGVDIIVGGHSHTYIDTPAIVNDILIVQAGKGTDQIGRFDLVVDTDTNTVHSWEWSLIPIDDETSPIDEAMTNMVDAYKEQTDKKYGRLLLRLPHVFTHPSRYQETELGNLFADAFQDCLGVDIVMYGSGSIRTDDMGPVVTYGSLIETVPYHAKMHMVTVTGAQLKAMWHYILREETFEGLHTEFFQVSKNLALTWSRSKQEFERFDFKGAPVDDAKTYTVAVQTFHFDNFDTSFGMPLADVLANRADVTVATDEQDVLTEFFTDNKPEMAGVDGRLTVLA